MAQFLANEKASRKLPQHPTRNREPCVVAKDNLHRISLANIGRMTVLRHDRDYLFVKTPVMGYLFSKAEMERSNHQVFPLMSMRLLEKAKPFRLPCTARSLRVRRGKENQALLMNWFLAHLEKSGPIGTEIDCLEGGFLLWKRLIAHAAATKGISARLLDVNDGGILHDNITPDTPHSDLWPETATDDPDRRRHHLRLVIGKDNELVPCRHKDAEKAP